jgi:putative hydrolase of the HAD superfamily
VIDAVVFDWGGTLTPWHDIDLVHMWRDVARVVDASRADELGAALAAAEDEVWDRARLDHRSGTIDEVFVACGLTGYEAVLAHYAELWEPHTHLDPDAPALFAGLRERGIKIGVLSNTLWPRDVHDRVFARDGVLDLIDGAVYTSEIKWTKPHPDAFRAALAAVEVADASRAVFVGDRLFDDIHGAKAVGMRAVLVPHSNIPLRQRGHTDGEPDAVVQRLGDVLDVVDSWRAGEAQGSASPNAE